MWNRLLILLGLRTDWTDPRYAPPAFGSEAPHDFAFSPLVDAAGQPRFDYGGGLLYHDCCAKCGGGLVHSIHHGKQVPVKRVEISPENVRLLESTREAR